MHSILYKILKPTKIAGVEIKNVIKYSDGINLLPNTVPRYEYFRGVEGESILDLTEYKGIEDNGDKIKVKAGTTWGEVLEKYNVEFWSNADFSVGGSVFFNDPITGFNEFGKIGGRVEVDAFLDGKYYSGKYKGGIVINVYLRKEDKEITYRRLDGNIQDLISIIKSWYSSRIPVFREVSVIKKGKESYILVSYPKIREVLLQNFIKEFSMENSPIIEHLEYKYWYFGYLQLNEIEKILNMINNSDFSVIRFRKDEIAFSIYSNRPLESIKNILDYSTTEGDNLFNGCILCGKCVNVCPYGKQVGDIFHTPLGFYTISFFEKDNELANCHMCGLCEQVCPVSLNITQHLKKSARLNEIKPKNAFKSVGNSSSVLIITPISENLIDEIIKSLIYLLKKGKKVSLLYLQQDFSKIIKDEYYFEELTKVKEIYTITPEEYFYLQRLKKNTVVDIYNIQLLIANEMKLMDSKLHIPCLLKNEVNVPRISCSNVFLNILNGKNNINKLDKEVTLCPLTARQLNIKTPLDLLGINMDKNYIDVFLKKMEIATKDLKDDIEEDLSWYNDIDNNIINEVYSNIINNMLKDESIENLVLLYFNLDKINMAENMKRLLTDKIANIIFS
ncbi:4Fe-4S dicluster domain-containing protein [Sulfolobus tengchongensis]|uniref:4Fe-4S dicluster domain-containing protein n=1 Tax=Sulfolobus tengchongensis TaxID=207809 RepID=A0AAX4KZR6_9CREN